MKVRVQFFSRLKDLVREPEAEYEMKEGATVADLLAELYACSPALRNWDSSILVGAGVEFIERDYVLRPNDQIAIMPPVQGG
ncbi:MAG TPA: MoaD/ThiS family protein [Chthoniobacterales bacterium]|nr:MoaD/ThiS family protein [Chthoniobacterales bacterium]